MHYPSSFENAKGTYTNHKQSATVFSCLTKEENGQYDVLNIWLLDWQKILQTGELMLLFVWIGLSKCLKTDFWALLYGQNFYVYTPVVLSLDTCLSVCVYNS